MFQGGGLLGSPSGIWGIPTTAFGIFDIALGAMMARPSKVSVEPGTTSTAKILVDRGVYGASIYQLAFFDNKLVMKRLATSRTTFFLGLLLVLVGIFLEGNLLIGAAAGGLTGYVLQEFLAQQRRDRIVKGESLGSAGLGDVELFYEKMSNVQIVGNRMIMSVSDKSYKINFPRGYTRSLGPALEKIIPRLDIKQATRLARAP